MSVISQKLVEFLAQKTKLLKSHTHRDTSANGANLGPIGHCHFEFKLGNKCLTDNVTVLKDLQRNLILGLNWQFNYKAGCNWNVNGHQYITYNNKYLCTSTPLIDTKPVIQNAGEFYLQARSVSIITVQTPS